VNDVKSAKFLNRRIFLQDNFKKYKKIQNRAPQKKVAQTPITEGPQRPNKAFLVKKGLFGLEPLQFSEFGETPLLFIILENCHYNSPVRPTLPFSTSAAATGPLSGFVFAYRDANAPVPTVTPD
jgi:hypothetical protein